MKLTILIMTLFLVQVSALTKAQITLNEKQASLQKVLKLISKQSGYDLICQAEDLKNTNPVTIKLNNVSVEKALSAVFSGQPLIYEVSEKTVMVKRNEEKSYLQTVIDRFQVMDIIGRVLDESGNALAGANVRIRGGKISVGTDDQGYFLLKNVDEKAILIISYLGYQTKEIKASKEIGDVKLELSTDELKEVVVNKGYYTESRKLSTGNVITVSAQDIEKQPVNNPLYALQGRIPGLQVIPTSGKIGAPVNVQIRGQNAIRTADNAALSSKPLIVVDGVPIMDNNTLGLFNTVIPMDFSSLSFLNPKDIESIDILKDADATSIYGSRGANGVVLINTKKGTVRKAAINVNLQSGLSTAPYRTDMMNTKDYLEMRKEGYLLRNIDISSLEPYPAIADVRLWDQQRFTNWSSQFVGNSAQYHDFQGSYSGGTQSLQYIIGGNYHKETAVLPGGTSDWKAGGHFSLTSSTPNKKFTGTLTTNYRLGNALYPGFPTYGDLVRLSPNAPNPYLPDGTLNWELLPSGAPSWNNPFTGNSRITELQSDNLMSSLKLNFKPFEFLEFQTLLSYNKLDNSGTNRIPANSLSPDIVVDRVASMYKNDTYGKNLSFEPQVNFQKKISNLKLEALLGASYQTNNSYLQSIFSYGYTSDALLGNLASASYYVLSSQVNKYRYNAAYARINGVWNNKYILNLTARRDGSSRFGPGRQFGNFFSIGSAWIFSEESSIATVLPFVSTGKIRANYGTTGNDGIGDYAYLDKYNPVETPKNYQGVKGYASQGLFNAYYQWEVNRKLEVAIDLGFFKDRLLLNTVYYRNRCDNQLLSYPFPTMAGPGNPLYNSPAVGQNSGIEILLESVNIKSKNFTWNTILNFSRNRNKLVAFENLAQSPYFEDYEVGKPFYGQTRVFKYSGVDPQSGIYQFVNADGDKVFNPAENGNRKYLRVTTTPDFFGGVSNSLQFKGVSLDFFVQFVKKKAEDPITKEFAGTVGSIGNVPSAFNDRWRSTGDVAKYQKIPSGFVSEVRNAWDWYLQSDAYYVDASFIRLKNLSVSYNFSNKWTETLRIGQLRLFAQAQNLFTLTNYKGADPESGIGVLDLPPLKTITAGLQITF